MKKRIVLISLAVAVCLFSAMPAMAVSSDETDSLPLLVDNANLLTEKQSDTLVQKLETVSDENRCDVVVVTVNSLGGKTATAYADDFYDYNGYGYGENNDGILFLLDMGSRSWAISTCGYGITAFSDSTLDYLEKNFKPYLSDGEYYEAFDCFAELSGEVITEVRTNGNATKIVSKKGFNWQLYLPASIIIGFIVSLVIVLFMKSKLKSVRFRSAADYVRSGSVNLSDSRDIFLYRNVSRSAKPKNNGGSGGSSTHSGSSGTSHGGSSGRF